MDSCELPGTAGAALRVVNIPCPLNRPRHPVSFWSCSGGQSVIARNPATLRGTNAMTTDVLSAFEQAAKECADIFNRLAPDDRRALHVRLLAIGALHAGDLDFITQVANEAWETVRDFVRDK
jgi:hypothetical protein